MIIGFALDLILWLQKFGENWFFDAFFQLISLFGEEEFYIVVLGLIYWIFNKRMGEFVGITLGVSITLNNVLKDLFQSPRPFEESNLVENKRPDTATGSSMPSGHTQGSASFFAAIAFYLKKRWMLIAAIVLTILMMFSRMYLGVHYLKDVLVGGILGFAVVIMMMVIFNKYQNNATMLHRSYIIIVLVFLPIAFLLKGNDFFKGYGILVGLVLAVMFEKKYVNFSLDVLWWKKVIRYVLGIVSMMIVLVGLGLLFRLIAETGTLKNILDFIRYFLIAFVGFGLYPWFFTRFKF